jgi:hypothetical protein
MKNFLISWAIVNFWEMDLVPMEHVSRILIWQPRITNTAELSVVTFLERKGQMEL